MADQAGGPTLIQSVQRALRLLEVVAEHDGRARAKELARAAGLPLATTYHLLRTCAHEGWLQRLDDGSYVLGHRIDVVREHGTAARGSRPTPAAPWSGCATSSAAPSTWPATSTARSWSSEIVDSAAGAPDRPVGRACTTPPTPPRWASASSASSPTAEREDYLARHPLHDLTPHTVVDRRRLRLPRARRASRSTTASTRSASAAWPRRWRRRSGSARSASSAAPSATSPVGRAQRVLAGAARVSRALALAEPPDRCRRHLKSRHPGGRARRIHASRHGRSRRPSGRCGRCAGSTTRAAGRRASPSSTWACCAR